MIPSFSPSIIRSIAEAWGHNSYGGDASNVNLIKVADVVCGECVARKNDRTANLGNIADMVVSYLMSI